MTDAAHTPADSSVVFNVRELMRLEQDRVAREEAEHQLRAAEAQARIARDAAKPACLQPDLSERTTAEPIDSRQAAMDERAQSTAAVAEAASTHEPGVTEVRRSPSLVTHASLVLAAIACSAFAEHHYASQHIAQARAAARAASSLAAEQSRALTELRLQLQEAQRAKAGAAAICATSATPTAASNQAKTERPSRMRRGTGTTKNRASEAVLDLGVDSDSSDPLEGL
jgi:hypothetical protein